MMRSKVIKKQGSVALSYEASVANPLDAPVIRRLEKGFPNVFLKFAVMQTAPTVTSVQYDITRMVTLTDYLKTDMDSRRFKDVLAQFWQLMNTCTQLDLPLKNIIFDAGKVYYDSWGSTLRFIYLPFDGIAPDLAQVRGFFASLPRKIVKPDEELKQLCDQYDAYFERMKTFSPLDFSAFLSTLSLGRTATVASGAGTPSPAMVSPQDLSTGIDLRSLEAAMAARQAAVAQVQPEPAEESVMEPVVEAPEKSDEKVEKKSNPQDTSQIVSRAKHVRSKDVPDVEPAPAKKAQQPATKNVEASEAKTIPLVRSSEETVFTLTRRRTGESFEVNGTGFVVGKSKLSSYQITDTATVSRSHALFDCENSECWMQDNGSSNGTYVNGVRLKPGVRTKLQNGDVIRMSDEEFDFREALR